MMIDKVLTGTFSIAKGTSMEEQPQRLVIEA